VFGAVTAVFAAPPIILVLAAFGVGDLSHAQYTAWHNRLRRRAGGAGHTVIALCAMTDRPG